LRLESFTSIDHGVLKDVSPYILDIYGYVFANYSNVTNGIARANYNAIPAMYSFPFDFLNDNKNIIYSNGKSVIYK
jgi:hypothetical protein